MVPTLTMELMKYINRSTSVVPLSRDDDALGGVFTQEDKDYDVDEDVLYAGVIEHNNIKYDVAINRRLHLVCLADNGDYDTPEMCHYYWALEPEDVYLPDDFAENDE